MSEIKVRLSIILPGSVMLSSQECDKNPKESYDRNKMMLEYTPKKGKRERCLIEYNTRKCKPARQSVNISKESYRYMTSEDSVPETASAKFNRAAWYRMSKKERLQAHLTLIAESLGGKVDSYEIFED